jgi:ligand-binding sensor domain-containing protein
VKRTRLLKRASTFGVVTFCFVISFCLVAKAQMLGSRIYRISENPQGTRITCLFKNHIGYIIVGTSNGTYRFDGIDFIPYQKASALSQTSVSSIFEDSDRRLWVGMQNGDIAYAEGNRLVRFEPAEGTPKKRITGFLEDKNKTKWISTDGEGIYYFSNGRIYNVNVDDGLAENNVYSIALTSTGQVLAGTDQGLSIIAISNGKKHITNISSIAGLPDNFIKTIIPAGDDRFWIGLQDKGFCMFDIKNRSFFIPACTSDWSLGQVNSLLQSAGRLWIGTENNGIFYYQGENKPLKALMIKEKKSLTGINSFLRDNEANIWMIGNTSDLIKTAGEKLELHIPYTAGTMTEVHAILSDHKNIDWTADDTGITEYVETKAGEHTAKLHRISELQGKTDIVALYEDKFHHLWVGTMGRGIFIFDKSRTRYRHLNENTLHARGSILSISGRDDQVFVSSLEGSSIYQLNDGNGSIDAKFSYTNLNQISNVGSNIIYSIYKDSKGRIWFATDGRGIVMLKEGRYSSFTETAGLKDKFIYSITEDHSGNIWFSTRDAGIYRYDGKVFKNYSIENGLSDVNISTIKTDRNGNIVIVHKKGIDILDAKSGLFSYFHASHGITEVNARDLGAVAQDSAGNILFCSAEGVIRYSPVSRSLHKPATVLKTVELFLDTLSDDASQKFAHDENSFTFSYTGLYYTDPEAVHYQYMLEGYSNEWVTTKDKRISFPRLPPGKYVFRVRSSINQSFTGADEVRFEFKISKAFWTTWWFILACIAGTTGLVYWYIKSREASLKKLERLRQEKIQFQFETLRNQVNPHFLFNSFNTLISTIEDDPKLAVEYVEQLSDFFRNIVTYRDKEVISLQEELGLLNTYFYIQKKRFGEHLNLSITASEEEKHQIFLPPLTLQLLSENAIKHNAVSKETPLTIEISTLGNSLLVKNNLNQKMSKPAGAGMGLQNIMNRYNLLGKSKVEVKNDGKHFIVSLPILKHI